MVVLAVIDIVAAVVSVVAHVVIFAVFVDIFLCVVVAFGGCFFFDHDIPIYTRRIVGNSY